MGSSALFGVGLPRFVAQVRVTDRIQLPTRKNERFIRADLSPRSYWFSIAGDPDSARDAKRAMRLIATDKGDLTRRQSDGALIGPSSFHFDVFDPRAFCAPNPKSSSLAVSPNELITIKVREGSSFALCLQYLAGDRTWVLKVRNRSEIHHRSKQSRRKLIEVHHD
jgi:hypothetical protein